MGKNDVVLSFVGQSYSFTQVGIGKMGHSFASLFKYVFVPKFVCLKPEAIEEESLFFVVDLS